MSLQIYSNPNLAAELAYQGGAGLGAGIGNGLAALGKGAAEYLTKRKSEADQLEQLRSAWDYLHGGGTQPGQEAPVSPAPFGSFGRSEGPDQGSGEGSATAQEQQDETHKAASKLTTAMRTVAEHGYGYSKDQANQLGLNQLKGLIQGETMRAAQDERAQKAAEMAAIGQWHASQAAHIAAQDQQAAQDRTAQKDYYAELGRYIPGGASIQGNFDPNNDMQYLLPPGQAEPGAMEQYAATSKTGYVPPPSLMREAGVNARANARIATQKDRLEFDKLVHGDTQGHRDAVLELRKQGMDMKGKAYEAALVKEQHQYEIAQASLKVRQQHAQTGEEMAALAKERFAAAESHYADRMTPEEKARLYGMQAVILATAATDPNKAAWDMDEVINQLHEQMDARKAATPVPAPAPAAVTEPLPPGLQQTAPGKFNFVPPK